MEKIKVNDLDSFNYTFYTHNAFFKVKELADIIYNMDPNGMTKYTKIITKIYNYMYSFIVDERELCVFINIPNYGGCSISDIVDVEEIDGLKYIGYEIHMSYLYENMYNPDKKDLWPEILKTIQEHHHIEIHGNNITTNKSVEYPYGIGGSSYSPDNIKKLMVHFNKINDPHNPIFLYIGDHYNTDSVNRIQVVTADPKIVIKEIKAIHPKAEYSKFDPMFIGDFRLRRTTIYLDGTTIADIYNTCKYEKVPYTIVDNIPIANIFLCLKLKLVDIWIIRVLVGLKRIEKDVSINIIKHMYEIYDELFDKIGLEYGKAKYSYYGNSVDLNIQIMREMGDRIMYPYYPHIKDKSSN
jgi:hypothetical protein